MANRPAGPTPNEGEDSPAGREAGDLPAPGPIGLLGLAVWLGLVAGFAELAAFSLIRAQFGGVWTYLGKIRHYPWSIPLVNVLALVLLAAPLAVLIAVRPREGRRAAPFLLVACALMPALMTLAPTIYFGALLLVAMGLASIIMPMARRRPRAVSRAIRATLPMFLVALAGLGAWRAAPGVVPRGGEAASPGDPNVLLIVLDTVRADRVRLDDGEGGRPTSPELAALAGRGVAFTGARSTSPWTLPSHASLMTGRYAFEVALGRYGAMIPGVPALAEVLSARGYDTVGMVANLFYCPYYTGISRGFARYEDIPATPGTLLASAQLGGRIVDLIGRLHEVARPGEPCPVRQFPRIDADAINRRFLDWVDRGRAEGRPFFAFLNYFDAHDPYVVPPGAEHRFGSPPRTAEERSFMEDWWLEPDKTLLTAEQRALLVDGYDSCIAYLDDRIGRLLRELDRRGLLEETVVVVTSDHGEAFGEHGLFGHGGSLFEDQLHVPLIVVAPGRAPEGVAIDDVVSLRDVPATILDLLGVPRGDLPGYSLAGLWGDRTEGRSVDRSIAIASVDGPDHFSPNSGRSPVFRGAMISALDERRLKYIRTEGRGGVAEELYALPNDPGEEVDLASPVAGEILDQFRALLGVMFRPDGIPPE